MSFKDFLLNEQKYYLGQQTGDVLAAVQNLEEDSPNMGNRAIMRAAEGIVNHIRRILHGRWDDSEVKYLKRLQKVGVAIMKSIEEKEDMKSVIAGASLEIQQMLKDLEVPINSVGADQENKDTQDFIPAKSEEEPIKAGTQLKA